MPAGTVVGRLTELQAGTSADPDSDYLQGRHGRAGTARNKGAQRGDRIGSLLGLPTVFRVGQMEGRSRKRIAEAEAELERLAKLGRLRPFTNFAGDDPEGAALRKDLARERAKLRRLRG